MKRLMILIALSFVIFLASCSSTSDIPQNTALMTVSNQKELARLLAPRLQTSSPFDFGFRAMAESSTSAQGDMAPQQSQTNVQVYGVDEGDIVKVDQRHIYRLDYQSVHVIELLERGAMRQRLHLQAAEQQYYTELYLTAESFIVIGVRYEPFESIDPEPMRDDSRIDIGFGWWRQRTFTTVEVYNKDTLALEDRFEIEGFLMTTRLIENTLYLVHNHTPQGDQEDDLRSLFIHNGVTSRPAYEDISYLPSIETEAFLIISKLSLGEEARAQHTTFLGNYHWGPMYVNHRGITFASHQFHVVNERFNNRSTYHALTTLIHFAFDDTLAPQFAGQAQLKGHVLDQFSIDEHEGYLRVFTTESVWDWQISRPETINRLYVLKHDVDASNKAVLRQVSLVDEGIGKPHETIRSARFMGSLATVVTFEMIDPFYTIDLTNPYEPVIIGELEITGFSTYQHPFYGHYVLGLGFETDERGQIIGIKVTLYDIEDTENPVVVGQPLVLLNDPQGWQFSEALYNHKAILVSEAHQLFGFSTQQSLFVNRQYFSVQEYLLLTIDPDAEEPVRIAGRINHQALAESHLENHDSTRDDTYHMMMRSRVSRAVFVDNTLYVLSDLGITSHHLEAPFEALNSFVFE